MKGDSFPLLEMTEHKVWNRFRSPVLLLLLLWAIAKTRGQDVPSSPSEPWINQKRQIQFERSLQQDKDAPYELDLEHTYSLAELINLAEIHNPDTRVAWQSAKARLEQVGVAKSSLYPAIAAVAVADTSRDRLLAAPGFVRQTIGLSQDTLTLNYLIFDFGRRQGAIAEAENEMFAADFAFNDVHRKLIYRTSSSYYYFLNAIGQVSAAEAALANAETVQKDAEARLRNGIATLPDILEARAATAQAEYDLQAADGMREVALGALATAIGLPPNTPLRVQPLEELTLPEEPPAKVEEIMDLALRQRPDLMEQVAKAAATDASLTQARSAYLPSLSFSGFDGSQRMYGRQDFLSGTYTGGETWNAELTLQWDLFDGFRRKHQVAEARAQNAVTKAQIETQEEEIANEVWVAYSNLKTAERQRIAAAALLLSAEESYAAALRSYDLGIRDLLDVVASQRTLAQARSSDIAARTQVLTQISNLAFRSGDLSRATPRKASQQP